ncbi:MAG: hypothetical protein COA74_07285 [Gammaproteobacteria bacterium]|nr:MAG: hypothetical protein COA74_07285 [Gammaproteobacteria bacterium]
MNKLILSVIVVCFASLSFAAEDKKPKPVQDAPKVKPGFVPRAEITIVENKDSVLKEYHIAGQLRAIKVTPKNGMPTYYLIDRKGTGEFIKLGPDMGSQIEVPNWIFFEW